MEGRPEQVRKAQIEQNSEALSVMGRKGGHIGGIHAAAMNADRKAQKEKDLDAFIEQQAQLYHVNDEGDVLPPENLTENQTRH